MPRAFIDTQQLDVFAGDLRRLADEGVQTEVRAFMRRALDDVAAKMREEVPKDSGETHDSITVEVDDDGMGGSVGPTNVDERGRPVGFFIAHGTSDTPPNPFDLRTALWAEKEIPDRADKLMRELFG